jgi:hypothetical protein
MPDRYFVFVTAGEFGEEDYADDFATHADAEAYIATVVKQHARCQVQVIKGRELKVMPIEVVTRLAIQE